MTDWTQKLGADLLVLGLVNAYWFLGLGFFLVRAAFKGMPRSPRFEKLSKSKVLPRFILEYGYWQLQAQARIFIVLGFSPDMVTMLSLLLAIGGAVLIGMGSFGLGGWLMFLSFFCDAFDGIVARQLGVSSNRGEFFDSVIDRYADTVTGLGFLYFYRNDPIGAPAAALMILGSTVMGYAKAKGEAMGVDPNVGIMQRHERGVYLGASTVLAPFVAWYVERGAVEPRYHLTLVALVLVAFFTNLTSIWRIAYVMRRMPRGVPQAAAPVVEEPTPPVEPLPVAPARAAAAASTATVISGHVNGHPKAVTP